MINFVQIVASAVLGGVLGGIAGFLIIVGVLMALIIGGFVCIYNKTRNKRIVTPNGTPMKEKVCTFCGVICTMEMKNNSV